MFTRIFVLIAMVLSAVMAPAACAAERISFIRDAEVENTIRAFATPLFEAAGLTPDSVRVFLVKEDKLNAFVAGGMNLFLNTGLLIRSEHAGQVVGVIAHETGHIAGGHLARMDEALRGASAESIVAMVLGAAAGIASGRPDVGVAVLMGGADAAQKNMLSFSRTQESSADNAGIGYLDRTRQSARGFLEFMEILGEQDLLISARQDPYVRTHPLTRERVSFLRHHVETSKWSNEAVRPEFTEMHRRMRAKLFAFLETPIRTMQRYKEDDKSLEARYARAIAYYRKPDMAHALPLIDALITERPADPYFHELKGQMLFENGRPREALTSYREAARLMPNAPLIRLSLAQVETELEDPSLLASARQNVDAVLAHESDNAFAWKLMAVAHGRSGNDGMASYAMAQYALLDGRVTEAIYNAERAERLLPRGSPAWLRVQDMKREAERYRDEMRKGGGRR